LEVNGNGVTTLDAGSFTSTGDGVVISENATVNLQNVSAISTDSGTENNGTINSDGTGNAIHGEVDGGGDIPTGFGDLYC